MINYDDLLTHSSDLISIFKTLIPTQYYLNKIIYTPVDNHGNLIMKIDIFVNIDNETKNTYYISNNGHIIAFSHINKLRQVLELWLDNIKKRKHSFQGPKLFDAGVIYSPSF